MMALNIASLLSTDITYEEPNDLSFGIHSIATSGPPHSPSSDSTSDTDSNYEPNPSEPPERPKRGRGRPPKVKGSSEKRTKQSDMSPQTNSILPTRRTRLPMTEEQQEKLKELRRLRFVVPLCLLSITPFLTPIHR